MKKLRFHKVLGVPGSCLGCYFRDAAKCPSEVCEEDYILVEESLYPMYELTVVDGDYVQPDAIDDQAQAHGEGRLVRGD